MAPGGGGNHDDDGSFRFGLDAVVDCTGSEGPDSAGGTESRTDCGASGEGGGSVLGPGSADMTVAGAAGRVAVASDEVPGREPRGFADAQ